MSPPMEGDLLWQLISNLTLNYLSLARPDSLRTLLSLYNFPTNRQLARENEARIRGIGAISVAHEESLYRGVPLRGLNINVELDEQGFGGEGDLAMFGSMLDEFFALYATINCTSRLTVKASRSGEVYEWPTRLGRQYLL
jgi:type VI secretion system protein ImpG